MSVTRNADLMISLFCMKWVVERGSKPPRPGTVLHTARPCVQVMLLVVIGFIALSYYCVAILTCGSRLVGGAPPADKLWAAVAFAVFTLLVTSLLAEGLLCPSNASVRHCTRPTDLVCSQLRPPAPSLFTLLVVSQNTRCTGFDLTANRPML